jgi:penicillin V acylase-like amidase (Ntn superfamily)
MCRPSPLVALPLAALVLAGPAAACTTFCLRGGGRVVFGKNYDWNVGSGMLVVNQRGVARTADVPGDRPASWTARFGSVTFNQYGRDFPNGGMNEAGLVVELMWLEEARYAGPDLRPAVDVLQWVQYQLDNHRTVREVLAADQKVRIASQVPLHYLVADRTGAVATVEILDGRLVAHTGKDLPFAALANSTYQASLASLEQRQQRGAAPPPGPGSLARFERAAARVQDFDTSGAKEDPVAYAFATLDGVAQGDYTRWSIVYELDRSRIHFRTRDRRAVRTVDLAKLDFSCDGPVRVLDLDADVSGDVTARLVPYSREINRRLLETSVRQTPFLADIPAAELDRLAGLPEAAICRR